VLRRNLDTSSPVVPWTVGRRGVAASAWEAAQCPGGASPVPLPIIDRLGELRFAEQATLEIRLGAAPRERIAGESGVVTQADFPRILAAIRAEAALEFGPRVDRADD
jgi:hypothetical protein